MSSRAKGRRTLNKIIDYYIEEGYIVDETELGGKFRLYRDLFAGYCTNCWKREDEGCCDNPKRFEGFDLIALKPSVVELIQAKTNTPSKQMNYKLFAGKFASKNVVITVATWYDYRGLRIQRYQPDGTIEETDLRK